MAYRFTTGKIDYSLFSPGSVLYSLPRHPAFPVRLASEMYLTCAEWLSSAGCPPPYCLYDLCCGEAYYLATLAYLQPNALIFIHAADIEEDALALAANPVHSELAGVRPDLVITDIPYGIQSAWVDTASAGEALPPAFRLLDSFRHVLADPAVVAVAEDKAQKISHPAFTQLRRMKIGHRQVTFLTPAGKIS